MDYQSCGEHEVFLPDLYMDYHLAVMEYPGARSLAVFFWFSTSLLK
jgi:hypothetical protein